MGVITNGYSWEKNLNEQVLVAWGKLGGGNHLGCGVVIIERYFVSDLTWQDSFPLSSTPRMMLCLRRLELTKARHFSSFLLS